MELLLQWTYITKILNHFHTDITHPLNRLHENEGNMARTIQQLNNFNKERIYKGGHANSNVRCMRKGQDYFEAKLRIEFSPNTWNPSTLLIQKLRK